MEFYAVVERPAIGRAIVTPVLKEAIEDFVAFKSKVRVVCTYSTRTYTEDKIKQVCLRMQSKYGGFDVNGYKEYIDKLIMGFKMGQRLT
jgi:hypothetical protein